MTMLRMSFEPAGVYTLEFPFLPKSKNIWESWPHMYRAGERKKWEKALNREITELAIPPADRVTVEVELWYGTKNRRDWQNFVHPLYWFLADALVRNHVIPDDTPDRFHAGPNGGIEFKIDRRKVPAAEKHKTVIRVHLERSEAA